MLSVSYLFPKNICSIVINRRKYEINIYTLTTNDGQTRKMKEYKKAEIGGRISNLSPYHHKKRYILLIFLARLPRQIMHFCY